MQHAFVDFHPKVAITTNAPIEFASPSVILFSTSVTFKWSSIFALPKTRLWTRAATKSVSLIYPSLMSLRMYIWRLPIYRAGCNSIRLQRRSTSRRGAETEIRPILLMTRPIMRLPATNAIIEQRRPVGTDGSTRPAKSSYYIISPRPL